MRGKTIEINEKTPLFHLTWPIFVEALLAMLIGNVDSLMLSNYSETAVGGIGNMNTIDNCFTRLRIVVNSMDTINEEALKETGSRGLVKRGNEIQIIYGTNVNKFRKALEDYMEANHISLEG